MDKSNGGLIMDSVIRQRIKEQEIAALHNFASKGRDARFWISWLEEQGFCEYKLCLKMGGVVATDSEAIVSGINAHREIETEHNKTAEFVGSASEAVSQSVGFGESISMAECKIGGGCLTGQVDGLLLGSVDGVDTAWLVDNKTPPRERGREPFFSHQRQALGYAVAWGWSNPFYLQYGRIVAVIRDKWYEPKSDLRGGWLWEAPLTNRHVKDIDETIDWVRVILRDSAKARDVSDPKRVKCFSCDVGKERKCPRFNEYLGL
jgi:hypothetical protein